MRILFTISVTLLTVSTAFAREFTRIELDDSGYIEAYYLKGKQELVCKVAVTTFGIVGQYSVLKQGRFLTASKNVVGTSFANMLASGVDHLLSEDTPGDLISFAGDTDKQVKPTEDKNYEDDEQTDLVKEAAGVVRMIKELCD